MRVLKKIQTNFERINLFKRSFNKSINMKQNCKKKILKTQKMFIKLNKNPNIFSNVIKTIKRERRLIHINIIKKHHLIIILRRLQ